MWVSFANNEMCNIYLAKIYFTFLYKKEEKTCEKRRKKKKTYFVVAIYPNISSSVGDFHTKT